MTPETQTTVSLLLDEIRNGRAQARDRLVEVVYEELRHEAGRLLAGERRNHSLDRTDLVNLKVEQFLAASQSQFHFENRRHLMSAATHAMRNILIDHARRRNAQKRGGQHKRVPLDDVLEEIEGQGFAFLDLNDALGELGELSLRRRQAVELSYFGGATNREIAEMLDVSEGTVERDLRLARAWLRKRLGPDQ